MKKLLLHPTAIAQWHALVNEGQERRAVILGEDLESYLVFLLMRFTEEPEIVQSILALEFLRGAEQVGSKLQQDLKTVGDKCLLFAGLFPERAIRKRVNVDYFVNIGQSAYGSLARIDNASCTELFASLSESFVNLTAVLQATREVANSDSDLSMNAWQQFANVYNSAASKFIIDKKINDKDFH